MNPKLWHELIEKEIDVKGYRIMITKWQLKQLNRNGFLIADNREVIEVV